tara:strand:- start:10 stop:426 length:417 start_codon:yes stop_codon:yes gene_type:complete
MNFFVRAIVILVIFGAVAKGLIATGQTNVAKKYSSISSSVSSKPYAKLSTDYKNSIAKKYIKPSISRANDRSFLSGENDRLLAEIKRNREGLNQIQNQLRSLEFATQNQNKKLQKLETFEHYKGLGRMVNTYRNMGIF